MEEYDKLLDDFVKAMLNTEKWYDTHKDLIKESFKKQYPKATNITTGYRYMDCMIEVYADFPNNIHRTYVYCKASKYNWVLKRN